jgi:hypothetical protein
VPGGIQIGLRDFYHKVHEGFTKDTEGDLLRGMFSIFKGLRC